MDVIQSLISRLSSLRDNTILIYNSEKLEFNNIEDGVLLVFASWSGPAIVNCTNAINLIYDHNYSGQIIVIDNDCMTPDFQIKMLGQACQGWGEIFIIKKGQIVKKYLSKNIFNEFHSDYNEYPISE